MRWHLPVLRRVRVRVSVCRDVHAPECRGATIGERRLHAAAWEMQHCIRAPPRRGRYWEIHPRRPKDFPRPERFPEGEARGKSRGSREIWRAEGMDFPIPPEFWWSTDNLSASIFLQGVDQKILPCGQGRIDSVKINPSLLMMTD